MNYIFDKEKIKKLLLDFQLLTGIPIVLYDASFRSIAFSGINTPYCSILSECKEAFEHCSMCNIENLKLTAKKGNTLIYTCHAGLIEVIKPIFYEQSIIAYLQLGQFRDEDQVLSSLERVQKTISTYSLDSQLLTALYQKQPIFSQSKLDALIHLIETLIITLWAQSLIYADHSALSKNIEQYLMDHLTDDLHIEDICKEFFISRNTLYRLFKTQFHTSIKVYILEKRMQQASKLLIESPHLSISEIAISCGFSDYNYFIRAFKKHYQITPLQFKKINHTSHEKSV